MNLRQLRYLVALADERHFTRAAAREHVAQPALSQQIRSLEAEVGVALVERTTRKVAMTRGRRAARRARAAVARELDAAEAELQSLAGVQTGPLSVGALHTMGPVDLSLLLARSSTSAIPRRAHRPRAVQRGARRDAARRRDRPRVPVGHRARSRATASTLRPLVSEELVVVLATEPSARRRERLRIGELAGEAFISFREGARLRELLDRAAASAGFEPRIDARVQREPADPQPRRRAASASRSCRARTPSGPATTTSPSATSSSRR